MGAACVGGILGAIAGWKLKKRIEIFGTALIGSFFIIRGIALYVGNFPSEFEKETFDTEESGNMLYFTIGYFVFFIILFIVGAIVQHRMAEKKEGDAGNLMED